MMRFAILLAFCVAHCLATTGCETPEHLKSCTTCLNHKGDGHPCVWVAEDDHHCIPRERAVELKLPAELWHVDFARCPTFGSHDCGPMKNARDTDTSHPRCDDEGRKCCVNVKEGKEKYSCYHPNRGCISGETAKPEFDYKVDPVKCKPSHGCRGVGSMQSGELCCADHATNPTKSECVSYPAKCSGATSINICAANSIAPCTEADYAHDRVDPVVAGVSMGCENAGNAGLYWSLGFILCDTQSPDYYGVTNYHNVAADSTDKVLLAKPSFTASAKQIYQPSKNGKDKSSKATVVADFADWKHYSKAPAYDAALIKFRDPSKVKQAVLTPAGPKPVLSVYTADQLTALNSASTKPNLYLAGRTSGWMVFKFKSFNAHEHKVIGDISAYDPTSFNPVLTAGGIKMPGNSGSGVYIKDTAKDAYHLVGMFDGEAPGDEGHFMAGYELVERINKDTGKKLTVDCQAHEAKSSVVAEIKSKGSSIQKMLTPLKK